MIFTLYQLRYDALLFFTVVDLCLSPAHIYTCIYLYWVETQNKQTHMKSNFFSRLSSIAQNGSTQNHSSNGTDSTDALGWQSVLWGAGALASMGAGLLGYALLREPLDIELERRIVYLPNARGRLPQRGLRILHLSDTHFQGINWRERTKINQIRRLTAGLEYDILIHTGDFWHNEAGMNNLLALLDLVPKPRLGSYGVLGNHDYACYSHADALTRNWVKFQSVQNGSRRNGSHAGPTLPMSMVQDGVRSQHGAQNGVLSRNGTYVNGSSRNGSAQPAYSTATVDADDHVVWRSDEPSAWEVLRNSWQFAQYVMNVPFELERVYWNNIKWLADMLASRHMQLLTNSSIRIQHRVGEPDGVDLFLLGVDDVSEGAPDLQCALQGVPADATKVLLSHHPDILEDPASRRVDLILSGHTHGGQIALPWLGAAHTQSLHLGRTEAAGYLQRDSTQVYISRGIGEGIPLRFCARPQITLLTLLPE